MEPAKVLHSAGLPVSYPREYVRLDERRHVHAEAQLQLVEEAEVDVDQLVLGAVERSDLRGGDAAAGLRLIAEQNGVDVGVRLVAALEDAVPELLHAVDDADDAAVVTLVRVFARVTARQVRRRVHLTWLSALPHGLLVERRELAQPVPRAAVGEQRDQQPDDQPDEPEATATDRHAAGPAHATAPEVGDLSGVEGCVASEPHWASLLPRTGGPQTRWYHRRAAAVGGCEPRQGRGAAALSIPSRRRGFLPGA